MARKSAALPMRSQLVGPALALVRAAGGAPAEAALASRFELPADAATAAEVVLPLPALRDFLDAAAAAAGDPWLGLHMAAALPRGAYGVLEYSCRSAPDIRGALTRIVRYIGLLNELITVSLEEQGGVAVIEQRVAGDPLCVGRHGNEFFVAMLLLRSRQLSGAELVPERAWFAHPAPAEVGELERVLGTRRLRWSAGANGMALPARALDLPIATSDPPLLNLLDRQAEQSLAGLGDKPQLLGLARKRVREMLGQEPPTLEALAAALRMSRRTLQRRLGDEGVTFQDLVEDTRRELALDYVRDPRRPLGEIAFQLGYAELSPFLRAFKRWTGHTPSQIRGRAQ